MHASYGGRLTAEHTIEHPFDSLHELPAGLYLDKSRPWCATAHEDPGVLILPFDVGTRKVMQNTTTTYKSNAFRKQIFTKQRSIHSLAGIEHSCI